MRFFLPLFLMLFFSLPAWAAEDPTSFQAVKKKAENGKASEQWHLAYLYEYGGAGVKQDYAEAMKWYRKAADQGEANAQVSIGWMYSNGLGVKKDDAEAFKWYLMAAEQGDSGAQQDIGNMYDNGKGIARDAEQAYFWRTLGWVTSRKQEGVDAWSSDQSLFSIDAKRLHLTLKQKTSLDVKIKEWKPHPSPVTELERKRTEEASKAFMECMKENPEEWQAWLDRKARKEHAAPDADKRFGECLNSRLAPGVTQLPSEP
jgi:hypothetical protein